MLRPTTSTRPPRRHWTAATSRPMPRRPRPRATTRTTSPSVAPCPRLRPPPLLPLVWRECADGCDGLRTPSRLRQRPQRTTMSTSTPTSTCVSAAGASATHTRPPLHPWAGSLALRGIATSTTTSTSRARARAIRAMSTGLPVSTSTGSTLSPLTRSPLCSATAAFSSTHAAGWLARPRARMRSLPRSSARGRA